MVAAVFVTAAFDLSVLIICKVKSAQKIHYSNSLVYSQIKAVLKSTLLLNYPLVE